MLPLLLTTVLLAGDGTTPRPDIVVLILDDVGPGDINRVRTPNIDALADRGFSFERAYSHSWCSPTRNSLYQSTWNGLHRGKSCAGTTPRSLDDGAPSLAKVFDGLGYSTVLVGKWHQGEATTANVPWTVVPQLHGFDHWRAGVDSSDIPCDPPTTTNSRVDDGVITLDSTHRTAQERDALIDSYWEAKAEGLPFFGVLAFTDAHKPWKFPSRDLLPRNYTFPSFPSERDLFEAEIVALDFVIGQIVAQLPPDVWYVLIGDNGTPVEVDVDRLRGHKHDVYEGGVRVPMIFVGPNVPRGRSDQPVHVLDIGPSLLAAMGLRFDWMEGIPLVRAMKGRRIQRDWVVCHTSEDGPTAVIEKRWKLVVDMLGDEELFDLEADPREANPLPAVAGDPVYERLRSRLTVLR